MCGIFGIYGSKQDVAWLTYLGLYALQHRGQESAGIAVSNGKELLAHRGLGLVPDVFNERMLSRLTGHIAIGHTRYSTTGSTTIENTQPFLVEYKDGSIAIGHNGNLINTKSLRDELQRDGSIFQSTMDSEIIVHLLAHSKKKNFIDNLIWALSKIKGAYSLVMLTHKELIGIRDPNGFRPLCIGKLGNSFVLASETCALDLIGAKFLRDVEAGEIVFINEKGIKSIKPFEERKESLCVFEYIYFARPDSNIFGNNVYLTRKKLGIRLASEYPVSADMVVPIPDSGNCAALGFSERCGIPFEMAIVRNHYIGRTFIQPYQSIRDFSVRIKLNPVKDILKGKKIVVVEDSIVRGTTSRIRVKTLRDAGAKEVHMRISCPPIKHGCFYGIDFPDRSKLIASRYSIDGIRRFLGLDSIGYLSIEGMLECMPLPKEKFCTACFSATYPVAIPKGVHKFSLERRLGSPSPFLAL